MQIFLHDELEFCPDCQRGLTSSLIWAFPSFHVSPPQKADGRGEGSRAAAGQPADAAAPAGGLPEDAEPAAAARPALPAQLLLVRPAEPAALGRRK